MASLVSAIILLPLSYLLCAIAFTDSRYHQVNGLLLSLLVWLASRAFHSSSWLVIASLVPAVSLLGWLCFILSPFSSLFRKVRSYKSRALDVLWPSETHGAGESNQDDISIDIIAVHGLASNPASAWDSYSTKDENNESTSSHHVWLRDSLPKEGLNARIMTFNHNTAWQADALNKSLKDHGNDLLRALRRVRQDHDRPIVFIGHSFGGLIVKQAFVNANEIRSDELHTGIIENTKGFIFLGVPHKGSRLTFLGKLASVLGHWSGSKTNLLEVLKPRSSVNEALHEGFLGILENVCGTKNTVCVFESASESFLGYPITQVVDKDSAVIDGSRQIGHDQKHRYLQRFDSIDNEEYRDLVVWLQKWAREVKVAKEAVKEAAARKVAEREAAKEAAKEAAEKAANEAAKILETVVAQELTDNQQAGFRTLAFEEMYQRQLDITKEAHETCSWILQHPTYQTWQQRQNGSLIWIKGKPGAGKSTIMNYILREHQQLRHGLMAFYFISGRGAEIQKTRFGVYRAILHQMFSRMPTLSSDFVAAYKERCNTRGKYGKTWTWHENEIKDFLSSAALRASSETRTQIFIDALDEAGDEEAVELLYYFIDLANEADGRLQICVSSRHYPLAHIMHSLEVVVEDCNLADITSYADSELQRKVRDKSKIEAIRAHIIKRSSGAFQWAYLVLPLIVRSCNNGDTLGTLLDVIKFLPQELEKLYNKLLSDLVGHEKTLAIRLLRWVCFSHRPMSLTELRYAMAIESVPDPLTLGALQSSHDFKDSDDGMMVWATVLSRGLLELKSPPNRPAHWPHAESDTYLVSHPPVTGERKGEWTVQPNHQTVNDFVTTGGLLQLEDVSGQSQDESGNANYLIMKFCIRYFATNEVQLALATILRNLGPGTEAVFAALENTGPNALSLISPERDGESASEVHSYSRGEAYPTEQDNMLVMIQDELGGEILDDFPFLQFAVNTWVAHAKYVERSTQKNRLSGLVELFRWPSTHITSFWSIMSWVVGYTDGGVLRYNADLDNLSLLHLAAKFGFTSTVERILSDQKLLDLDSKADDYIQSALNLAIDVENEAIVHLFLESGKIDPTADVALFTAVRGKHIGNVRSILRYMEVEPDYNESAFDGGPISWASYDDREEILELLLDDGRFATNMMNSSGRPPLHEAARLDQWRFIETLLRTDRADVNAMDSNGRMALIAAMEVLDPLKGLASIKVLLDSRDIDANMRDRLGRTALHYAAEGRANDALKLLVDSGKVDLDLTDNNGSSALHFAAYSGNSGAVKVLLDKAANAELADESGCTALLKAARSNHTITVDLLLRHGVSSRGGATEDGTGFSTQSGVAFLENGVS